MNNLWESFERYNSNSERIDIIFDNYSLESVKSGERRKRAATDSATRTSIPTSTSHYHVYQKCHNLACDDNKIRLQHFFIELGRAEI